MCASVPRNVDLKHTELSVVWHPNGNTRNWLSRGTAAFWVPLQAVWVWKHHTKI